MRGINVTRGYLESDRLPQYASSLEMDPKAPKRYTERVALAVQRLNKRRLVIKYVTMVPDS